MALHFNDCFVSLTGFIDTVVAVVISATYDLEYATVNEIMMKSHDKI